MPFEQRIGPLAATIQPRPFLMEEPQKSRAPLIAVVAVVCAAAFSYTFVRAYLNRAPNVQTALIQISSEMNKKMPIVVDKETRLDSTAPGPNQTLTYRYTLVNFDGAEVKKEEVATIRARALAGYRTSPAMKSLREMGVTLRYEYKNKNGASAGEFSIGPKDF